MALLIFGVFASLSLHVLWCDDLRCVVSVSSVLCEVCSACVLFSRCAGVFVFCS